MPLAKISYATPSPAEVNDGFFRFLDWEISSGDWSGDIGRRVWVRGGW
jgi:hypothetical protein